MTSLAALEAQLADGVLLTDPGIVAGYRADRSVGGAAGHPLALVRARSTADVQATMAWANDAGIPVVPRGAGTGLSGGALAVDGALLLSLERIRGLRIDRASRVAVAAAGMLNAEVKRAAAEHGLFYPPDPSSFEISSIGGNVATNAGGLCCNKYGVTADYVLGLEVVLADGRALRLGGPRLKDVAGLALAKLFVGSEGTLGIITEATLRLIPAPGPFSTLAASFPELDAAAEAVVQITSTMRPSMLELMDRTTIRAVDAATRMGLDTDADALLIARSDADMPTASRDVAAMADICRACGATEVYCTDDQDEGEALAAARRAALPAFEQAGQALLLDDVGVGLAALPTLIRGIQAIGRDWATTIAIVAHAGDGNVHPLVVYDARDSAAERRAHQAFDAVLRLVLDLDGTITGEHGIGRLKTAWLPEYLGADALELTRQVKRTFDPKGILNPGCLLRD